MINKASTKDTQRILDSLKHDPSRSLFITGDIQQNGIETDYQEVWLDEDDNGLHAIILRYHTNLVLYVFDAIVDTEGFRKLFNDSRINLISATGEHMRALPKDLYASLELRPMFFCECRKLVNEVLGAQRATLDDVEDICVSLSQIEEFNQLEHRSVEEQIKNFTEQLRSDKKVAYIIREDGKVVSQASSSAMTDTGCMVVGVFTLPGYRKKGYARQVVSNLTAWALDHGKVPCLFYDNPQAGTLYHHLGYVTFDQWLIGKKKS
jgi:predicted GNAT family acetyltransferase